MNINALMQQAQKMQQDLKKAQAAFDARTFEFTAAGGAIKLKMSGKKELLSFDINEEVIDKNEKDMLQDMIIVALNEAISKVKAEEEAIMSKQTGGMNIPGLF